MVELIEIKRTLRPLRSRLLSLSKSLDFPSLNTHSKSTLSHHYHNAANSTSTNCNAPITAYGSGNSIPGASRRLHSSDLQHYKRLALEYPSLPQPILRHTLYFRCSFRDILAKYTSSPESESRFPKLSQLCCYEIGGCMEYFDDLDDQMLCYEYIPAHYRKVVLLQHLTHLVTVHVCVRHLLDEILRVYMEFDARNHILTLLEHSIGVDADFNLFQHHHVLAQSLRYQNGFMQMLQTVVNPVGNDDLAKFCSHLDPSDGSLHLIFGCFERIVVAGFENELSHDISLWTHLLISKMLQRPHPEFIKRLSTLIDEKEKTLQCYPDSLSCLDLCVFLYTGAFPVPLRFQDYHAPLVFACFASTSIDSMLDLLNLMIDKKVFVDVASFLATYSKSKCAQNDCVNREKLEKLAAMHTACIRLGPPVYYESQFDEWFQATPLKQVARAAFTPRSGSAFFSSVRSRAPSSSVAPFKSSPFSGAAGSFYGIEDDDDHFSKVQKLESSSNIYPHSSLLTAVDYSEQDYVEFNPPKRKKPKLDITFLKSPQSGSGFM